MDTFDIVTVIAIILFARLGVRLLGKFLSQKKKHEDDDENNS